MKKILLMFCLFPLSLMAQKSPNVNCYATWNEGEVTDTTTVTIVGDTMCLIRMAIKQLHETSSDFYGYYYFYQWLIKYATPSDHKRYSEALKHYSKEAHKPIKPIK